MNDMSLTIGEYRRMPKEERRALRWRLYTQHGFEGALTVVAIQLYIVFDLALDLMGVQ